MIELAIILAALAVLAVATCGYFCELVSGP